MRNAPHIRKNIICLVLFPLFYVVSLKYNLDFSKIKTYDHLKWS